MKKVLGAVLVVALVLWAGASCAMGALGSTIGSIMAICEMRPSQGTGALVVSSELPQVDGYSKAQLTNAAVIIATASMRGMGAQGARIGLITALQESALRNLANAGEFDYPAAPSSVMTSEQWAALKPVVATSTTYPNDGVAPGDWDSIGLFQGRFSITRWSGDGSDAQRIQNLLNPSFTAGRFFDALTGVTGWRQMRPGAAAQAVQRSAYPDAYDQHWDASGELVEALTGVEVTDTSAGPCSAPISGAPVTADGWTAPITDYSSVGDRYGMRFHPIDHVWRLHAGQDFPAPRGTPIYAAAAGVVVKAGAAGGGLNWVVVDHGGGVLTRYLHSDASGILVKVGQPVTAGQEIALVGSSGKATGPHLHFEVSVDGRTVEPLAFLASHGVKY